MNLGEGHDANVKVKVNAAAPKTRDFANTTKMKKSMGSERVHTIPIKASKESVWARMKVTAFSKIAGKS